MTILLSKIWKMHPSIVLVDGCGLPHLGWLNTWFQLERLFQYVDKHCWCDKKAY